MHFTHPFSTSSAHVFCKGLPNVIPMTLILLVGLSKAAYVSSRDVSIIENVCEQEFSKRQPAPLGVGAGTLTGQTTPILLSQVMGHLSSPTESSSNLEDHGLCIQKAANQACTSLSLHLSMQHISADNKHSQLCFKSTTDQRLQLLV